jgi:hypothetical protein
LNIVAIETVCPLNLKSFSDYVGTVHTGMISGMMIKVVDDEGTSHAAGKMSFATFNKHVLEAMGNDVNMLDFVGGMNMAHATIFECMRSNDMLGKNNIIFSSSAIHMISELEIDKGFRSLGLGNALMTLFMRQFPGVYALVAETGKRPWLEIFYSRLGFDVIGSVGEDKIMVRGDIPPMSVKVIDGEIITS